MNTQNNQYTVDYFLNKFSAIPEDKWLKGGFGVHERHCALGHCGVDEDDIDDEGAINHEEGKALSSLLLIIYKCDTEFNRVYSINDGLFHYKGMKYKQSTPKARILAALQDIKDIKTKQALDASEALISKALSEDPEEEMNDSGIDKDWRVQTISELELSEG